MLSLEDLQSNTTCSLFGWGQQSWNPRRETVSIYSSEFCDPALPQVSCSTFESNEHSSCSATLGSPVLCDEDLWFSGFVITEGCVTVDSRVKLNYHSISPYRNWIDEVIRADAVDRLNSQLFVVNIMQLEQGRMDTLKIRCSGTIIHLRRVAIDFSRKNRRLTLQKQEKAGDLKNFRNKEKTGIFCRGWLSGLLFVNRIHDN